MRGAVVWVVRLTGAIMGAVGVGVLVGNLVAAGQGTEHYAVAQAQQATTWAHRLTPEVPAVVPSTVGAGVDGRADGPVDGPAVMDAGGETPVARLWIERDGRRAVFDDDLYVGRSTSPADLTDGPGHYPSSAAPGASGNFAVAGHRSTHGAPFAALDRLGDGDEIHVVDPHGERFVYRYHSTIVVQPDDVWVIGADPLGAGERTVTLTTCHPRHSARQRLVVFGVLVEDAAAGGPSG